MIVTCISNPHPNRPEYAELTVGFSFLVFSIKFDSGGYSHNICMRDPQEGYPVVYDLSHFDIIDPRIPSDWMCKKVTENGYDLSHREFTGDFWVDFHDGDKVAEETFLDVLKEIVYFHGENAIPCLKKYDDYTFDNYEFKFKQELGFIHLDRIHEVEHKIGFKFPTSYKDYIQTRDGGMPVKRAFSYYDDDRYDDRVEEVHHLLSLKNDNEEGGFLHTYYSPPPLFPKGIVAFADNGQGDFIGFDYRKGHDNPDPYIVFWHHNSKISDDISFIAHTFSEFIKMLKDPDD